MTRMMSPVIAGLHSTDSDGKSKPHICSEAQIYNTVPIKIIDFNFVNDIKSRVVSGKGLVTCHISGSGRCPKTKQK